MEKRINVKYDRLRDYQKIGVKFLTERKTALLADDMGLGKTAQLIVAAEQKNEFPWVVVCPTSVRNQWWREIAKWTDNFVMTQVITTGKDKLQYAQVYIVSYGLAEALCKKLGSKDIAILMVDESHYCKNIEAQRTIHVLGKNFLGGKAKNIWTSTGTPIFNRPYDLYATLVALYPKALVHAPSPEDFAIRYNRAYWVRGAFRTLSNMRLGKSRNEEELKMLLEGFMLRRLKKDVLEELPSISVNMVSVDTCSKTRLAELAEKHKKAKEPNEKREMMRDSRGEIAKLRREYAYLKVDFAIDYIKNEVGKYGKVVVYAYHRGIMEELRTGLRKFKPVIYQGGMNAREKDEALAAFKTTDSNVFIGQVRAAGVGLDGLQHVSHRGIFVEWDYAPGAVNQAIDRQYRIGQERGVLITFLVIPDSIESDMINSVSEKKKENKKIIG